MKKPILSAFERSHMIQCTKYGDILNRERYQYHFCREIERLMEKILKFFVKKFAKSLHMSKMVLSLLYQTTTKPEIMTTFEIGKTYIMTFIGDSNLKVPHTVIKRTEKRLTIKSKNEKEPVTVGIKIDSDGEYCLPTGSYSMAPRVHSKRQA